TFGAAGAGMGPLEPPVEPLGGTAAAAGEALTRLDRAALVDEVLLLDRIDRVAAFDRRDVEQLEFWIVGAGLPVLAAVMRRAQPVAGRPRARAVAARR